MHAPAPSASALLALTLGLPLALLVACGSARTASAATASAAAEIGSDANPVVVPQLPSAFTVDGDPIKWASIPALPAPFSRKASGMLKLAWRPEGIYGLLQTPDDRITVDAFNPWTRDCLELWLETDYARAYDMSAHSYQIALAPNPDAGPGHGVTVPAQGALNKEKVQLVWEAHSGRLRARIHDPLRPGPARGQARDEDRHELRGRQQEPGSRGILRRQGHGQRLGLAVPLGNPRPRKLTPVLWAISV